MSEELSISTEPTKRLLVENLTRDVSETACIFDFIDNSIDAARNNIYKKTQIQGIPTSYEGYEINIEYNNIYFQIYDNCSGIKIDDFQHNSLRLGQKSDHKYGIGIYGVGLNRAIFKLGNKTQIETESESARIILNIHRSEYLESDSWEIPAQILPKNNKLGTSILIEELDQEFISQIDREAWNRELIKQASIRYARFLKKGLIININNFKIQPTIIEIRENGFFEKRETKRKLASGVEVLIESGQHIEHRFPAERGHSKATNNRITNEFGWSVVCNDRVIVYLDVSPKTGWVKKWHNEFNGFVGYVHFTSEDPEKLPWNTQKTDIDVNHRDYSEILEVMKDFTQSWRSNASTAKRAKQAGKVLDPDTTSPRPQNPTPKNTPRPKIKKDNEYKTVLPQDISESFCNDKLLSLVKEAKSLNIRTHKYSSLMLIRSIFEISCQLYLIRHKKHREVRNQIIKTKEEKRGKKFEKEEKKYFSPTPEELADVLIENEDLWADDVAKFMKHSLTDFKNNKGKMNSAVHQPIQTISSTNVKDIRDEVIPLLRFFIESNDENLS